MPVKQINQFRGVRLAGLAGIKSWRTFNAELPKPFLRQRQLRNESTISTSGYHIFYRSADSGS